MHAISEVTFCGRRYTVPEVDLMRVVARDYAGLGVTEIAGTICELLEWTRPSGGLKNHECRQLLERLAAEGVLTLPALRNLGGRGSRRVNLYPQHSAAESVECAAGECEPLELALVEGEGESRRWCEHVERCHYLGAACRSAPTCATGCGVATGTWRVCSGPRQLGRCRRETLGLDGVMSKRNLQWIVNNGRFLILPWVRVKGLPSKILA